MATGHYVDIEKSELKHLSPNSAQVLCALGEAFIGADFSAIVDFRRFVLDVDDLMNYQREETRDNLLTGLSAIQSTLLRWLGLGIFKFGRYTHFSLAQRQDILRKLKEGSGDNQLKLYMGFNNLVCSSFFGDPAVWPEFQYEGVSVDNQCVLQGHRWRPHDSREVEKCDPDGPC